MHEWLWVGLLSLSPVAELRASIPFGLFLGLPSGILIPYAILLNCLSFFPIYFGLQLLYERVFSRFRFARRIVERTHLKARSRIERWGEIGLIFFVAIPLPGTGVWTATLIAWLFGLDWKKSFLVISLGAVLAGCLVSAVALGLLSL